MTNYYKIYYYKNKINGKIYIGQTKNTLSRRSSGSFCSYKNCTFFYNALQKYGIENFDYEIILDNLTNLEADYWERYFIEYLQTMNHKFGYNLKSGGSNKGSYVSNVTKEKLSKSHKTSKIFQDKIHSVEYRNKMTETLIKRYKEHPEIAEKIGRAHRGMKRSPETGKKISAARMNHPVEETQRLNHARKVSKLFYNLENLETKDKYINLTAYEVFKIIKIPHIDLYAKGLRGHSIYKNFKITLYEN